MAFVGAKLAERGFTVVGPKLPGHADTAPALDATTWLDWYASVVAEFDALKSRCDKVAVVGLSLGGLLTLHLARHRGRELAAIAPLAVPLWLAPVRTAAIRALAAARRLSDRFAYLPKLGGGSDLFDKTVRAQNPALPVMPTRALASVVELMRVVRAEIELVTVPTFNAHAHQDHTAPFACALELRRRIGAQDLVTLDLVRSYHVVTLDVERDLLVERLGVFLQERLS